MRNVGLKKITQPDKEALLKQLRQYNKIETRGVYGNREPIISSKIRDILKKISDNYPELFAEAVCTVMENLKNIEDIEYVLNSYPLQCYFIDNKKQFVSMVYNYFSKRRRNHGNT